MIRQRILKTTPALVLTLSALCWMTSPLLAGKAGRWAGKGAAGGAVLGLLVGGDLGSAAEGAALGAAAGAASGAISESKDRKRARQAELEELRRREAERQRQDAERAAEVKTQTTHLNGDLPQTDEEWEAAIGMDNVNALDALIDCQHARARLLAQAAATVENPEYRLVSHWIEALVELDRRNHAEAERLYEALIPMDDDVDTRQQASLLADQALLEVRRVRREEGGHCQS